MLGRRCSSHGFASGGCIKLSCINGHLNSLKMFTQCHKMKSPDKVYPLPSGEGCSPHGFAPGGCIKLSCINGHINSLKMFTQCHKMKDTIETYPLPSGEGGGLVIVRTQPVGVGELGAGVHACHAWQGKGQQSLRFTARFRGYILKNRYLLKRFLKL